VDVLGGGGAAELLDGKVACVLDADRSLLSE